MPGSEAELIGSPAAAPIALQIMSDDRAVKETWEEIGPGHHRVSLEIGPGESTFVSVLFPGEEAEPIMATRALDDKTWVSLPRGDFSFEHFYLALPTGVTSLGGGRFVIKDEARVHLAAQVFRDSGDVVFRDETTPKFEPATWAFHVFTGSPEEALRMAERVNVARRLVR
jgi:hypothetical protein